MIRKIRTFMASWWCTALLLFTLAALYTSFSFSQNPWPAWSSFTLRSPAGLFIYSVLVANLIAVSIRVAIARLRTGPATAADVRQMDSFVELPLISGEADRRLAEWLRNKGFRATVLGNTVVGRKGALSFLPGSVLRFGIVLFLVAAAASSHLRKQELTIVHAGDPLPALGAEAVVQSIEANLPDDHLQVGEDSTLILDAVSATIASGNRSWTITSRAPRRVSNRYVRVAHVGYAQKVAVRGHGSLFDGAADLNVLPPGKSAVLALLQNEVFLTFTLEPERVIIKGILKGKQYDLRSPLYHIVLQRGNDRAQPYNMNLRPGQNGSAGKLSIRLGEQSIFATLQVVSDPALFWVQLGILVILAGLAMMFGRSFWFEKRFCAVIERDRIVAGYSEEFYKKWGITRFQEWKAELDGLNRP